MNEKLKRLSLEDLKSVNGGQIYFAIAEDGPCWSVPWPAIGGVCVYHNEDSAVKRAEKLGLPTDVKYCDSPEKAQKLAELAAFGHKITQKLNMKLLNFKQMN